jgi:hypothetical protein
MLPYDSVYSKGLGWESIGAFHRYLAPEHNDTETHSSSDDRIFYTSGKGPEGTHSSCTAENIALHLFQNRVILSFVRLVCEARLSLL